MTENDDSIRLLLVRHGATAWNNEGRIIGSTDLPLSTDGRKQAQQLGIRLSGEPIDIILSSDLRRASETARIISVECKTPLALDNRLREVDFGLWEGMTVREIQEKYTKEFDDWKNNSSFSPPNGERYPSITGRMQSFLGDLKNDHSGNTVLIVSHGVILQMMIFQLMDFPYRNDWHFYMFNGSITEMMINKARTVMVYLNDTHHLSSIRT
jgi:broad specificity phosphatase PhoE